jgi:hypothetical protein
MTFLQPLVLWGLPLILLPIIIHLLNRIRHRSQPWAAMRFLVSATRSSISNARLRQWLILLFRVLAVLMLVLFLSRPLAGGWLGWALAPAPDAVLILLDRSASMETQITGNRLSKREQALRSIAQAAKQFEESSHLILIDSALRTPQEIGKASSLKDLSLTAPTDTAADIPGMMAVALNWLLENHAGTAEIWIASDLQKSNWQPQDPRWQTLVAQFSALPQRVRVRLLALDQLAEPDRSISLKEMIRRAHPGQNELQFAVDIQANSRTAETIPITVNLDGTRTQKELRLEDQALRWRHKLSLGNKTAAGWGSFELPSDGNARDNAAYFVYGAETPLRAAIVNSEVESARVLQLALAAGTRGATSTVEILEPANLGRAVWEDDSLLVWEEPIPTGALAQKLRAFVEQGGVAVFLPPGRPDPQRFEGIGWGEVQSTAAEKPFRIARWEEDEGPLAKTDEGLSLPLRQTTFVRRQAIVGQKDVLAAFEDGVAFLSRQNLGRGEVYFCGSLPEAQWSSLADGPVLVPMFQRLLQAGGRRLQQAFAINCGELGAVDQARRWETVDAPTSKDIATQAGVYRSAERLLAVNRPISEDDPEVLDGAEAKRLFGPLSLQMLEERRTRSDALQGEVWRMFVFVMLLVLVGEGILMLPARAASSGQKARAGFPPASEPSIKPAA